MALKQIKIKESVYNQLNSMKNEDDSFSNILQRLIDENKLMKERNVELKQDKEMLMKIAMKTPDSIAFPEIAHYIYFALTEVLKENDTSDEEKLTLLKTYLKPSLDKDTYQALHYVEEFQKENDSNVLNELLTWIKETYHA